MASAETAKVYLVGAGPGDPGLITVRGARLLELADVVVYDYLANPRLLSYCPRAESIYVGKQAASHSMTQAQINSLLIDKAKEGKKVVRLKGGDPFVFGRGGEECEALARAGIPFEVVPGITAAIAAPTYAGIPVTHRDFNSSFTFLTGHEKEEEYRDSESRSREPGAGSDLDWSAIAKLPCLAFYMGVKSLPRICAKLLENGMRADMPAATIQWGSMPQQRTVVGTISDLTQRVEQARLKPPALTIVGQVVSLRQMMNWFEARPLFGQTIIVTRTRQQASELSQGLIEQGANVIEAPTIELAASKEIVELDRLFGRLASGDDSYDWIVFTSVNGVAYAKQHLLAGGYDVRAFGQAKIAAVGESTARAIREQLSLQVNLLPERFVAEALAEALAAQGEIRGKRFLLLRADIARPILREHLEKHGAAEVRDVAIYETVAAKSLPDDVIEAIANKAAQWLTFASSSAARNFATLVGADYPEKLRGTRIASIGPITSATLRELDLPPTVEAPRADLKSLINAIATFGPPGRNFQGES